MKTTSKLFYIDWRDGLRGLTMAMGAAACGAIQSGIQNGIIHIDFKTVAGYAIAGGLTYIGHAFITPAQTVTPAQ